MEERERIIQTSHRVHAGARTLEVPPEVFLPPYSWDLGP